jgi:hypothetical protein
LPGSSASTPGVDASPSRAAIEIDNINAYYRLMPNYQCALQRRRADQVMEKALDEGFLHWHRH